MATAITAGIESRLLSALCEISSFTRPVRNTHGQMKDHTLLRTVLRPMSQHWCDGRFGLVTGSGIV